MELYQAELHCHTSEVSPCSRLPAKYLVEGYLGAGYKYVFITDHYHPNVLSSPKMRKKPWEERIDHLLSGYTLAKKYAEGTGVTVLPAFEVVLKRDEETGIGDDFLVYGASEDFLKENPYLYTYEYDDFYELMHKNGCLVIQAHPYRHGRKPIEPICYDGVEAVNAHSYHFGYNKKAVDFALRHDIYLVGGSDAHSEEDIGRGGVMLPKGIETAADFVQFIRANGSPELIVTFGA